MLEQLIHSFKEAKIIIEDHEGQEYLIDKIYEVKGRAGGIKILVFDAEKQEMGESLRDLEHDYKILKEEKETAESELEKAEKELDEIEEKHEEELNKIENSLESAERFFGIKTSERFIHHRIAEFSRKLEETFEQLTQKP